MKKTTRYAAPLLAALAIGGTVAFTPVANAAPAAGPTTVATAPAVPGGTDPLVPYGTDPQVPYRLGMINPNHDNADSAAGQLDLPF
jgi:hypothetical protein